MTSEKKASLKLDYLTPFLPDPEKDKEELEKLWEHMKGLRYIADDSTRDNPAVFLQELFAPNSIHFRLGDNALFSLTNMTRRAGVIHFTVWGDVEPKIVVKGVEELVWLVFTHTSLERLTATIPTCNTQAQKLAQIQGFKFEGSLREAFQVDGMAYNLELFGLLKKEWLKTTKTKVN